MGPLKFILIWPSIYLKKKIVIFLSTLVNPNEFEIQRLDSHLQVILCKSESAISIPLIIISDILIADSLYKYTTDSNLQST